MDITKFNKELGTKIALAKKLEKNNRIEAAIDLWVEISEMILNFSKSKNLDVSFRHMLISRTKGILDHIKNLKSGQIDKEIEQEIIQVNNGKLQLESSSTEAMQEFEIQEGNSNEAEPRVIDETASVFEKTDLRNLPNGFKEIRVSEDFKIITPHDEDFVKKQLSHEVNMDAFKGKKEEKQHSDSMAPRERFDFEEPENKESLICFACGTEMPTNKKVCPNCGTSIDSQKL